MTAAILDDLQWRGLLAQSTDLGALAQALEAGPVTYYGGFDPTAPSLHIGHLVLILTLRRLQLAGHRPVALVGGATGLIGDPSGKTVERNLNSPDVVAEWVGRIRAQIEPFLSFSSGPNAAVMVNNLEWTDELSAIEFLRDVGKHFRVNRMIAKEAVSARLRSEAGISFTEFSYQVLQGMDFLELYRRLGCTLQLGGSDQWGNLTAGLDLIHRVEGRSVHALATPLITKADGAKFSKTGSGTIWLDSELTTPYAFYQFWLNAPDSVVVDYLKVFSFRGRAEIEALGESVRERPAAREAQHALAGDLTRLVHGEVEYERSVAASAALFGGGALGDLDPGTLAAALAEIPRVSLPAAAATVTGLPSYAELLAASGLASSKSAARRTVAEGGAYVNNRRIDDADARPAATQLLHGRWLVLRRGKRHVAGVDAAPRAVA